MPEGKKNVLCVEVHQRASGAGKAQMLKNLVIGFDIYAIRLELSSPLVPSAAATHGRYGTTRIERLDECLQQSSDRARCKDGIDRVCVGLFLKSYPLLPRERVCTRQRAVAQLGWQAERREERGIG